MGHRASHVVLEVFGYGLLAIELMAQLFGTKVMSLILLSEL